MNTERIPFTDLTPGRYINHGNDRRDGWYKVEGTPKLTRRTPNSEVWTLPAHKPGGTTYHPVFFGELNEIPATVEVTVHGEIPDSFDPATMRRRANELQDRAQALLEAVSRLCTEANTTEQEQQEQLAGQ